MTSPPLPFLPYGRHAVDEDDVSAVAEVLRSSHLTTGPMVERFETALAAQANAPYAVVCNSGTAALHLATLSLGIGAGDCAIVPANTFAATANAVRLAGGEVVVADIDPETGLLTRELSEAAFLRAKRLGLHPKLILPVHFAGHCADMQSLADWARHRKLGIVEDACHALGGDMETPEGMKPVGNCHYADFTVFSFHPVKAITMGEGGALTTRNPELAQRARRLRSHGVERDPARFQDPLQAFGREGRINPWYYEVREVGLNYRASDIACALGLSQLGKLERFIGKRRELARQYDEQLRRFDGRVKPLVCANPQRSAHHLYVVRIDFEKLGMERGDFMRALAERGIGTQVHYIPLPWHPAYRDDKSLYPGACAYYASCLSLPLFPSMSDEDVQRVVAALADLTQG